MWFKFIRCWLPCVYMPFFFADFGKIPLFQWLNRALDIRFLYENLFDLSAMKELILIKCVRFFYWRSCPKLKFETITVWIKNNNKCVNGQKKSKRSAYLQNGKSKCKTKAISEGILSQSQHCFHALKLCKQTGLLDDLWLMVVCQLLFSVINVPGGKHSIQIE